MREPGADHDPVRMGTHPPHPREVVRQRGPQLRAPLRIPGPERLARRRVQRPPRRRHPRRAREGRRVGLPLAQVVRRPRRIPGDRSHPGPGARRGQRLGPPGHPRPGPLPRGQPALGDQLRVRVGDGVARDAQIRRERTIRRQRRVRPQPSAADRLPDRPDQPGPPPARPGHLQMQIPPDPPGRIVRDRRAHGLIVCIVRTPPTHHRHPPTGRPGPPARYGLRAIAPRTRRWLTVRSASSTGSSGRHRSTYTSPGSAGSSPSR